MLSRPVAGRDSTFVQLGHEWGKEFDGDSFVLADKHDQT